MRRRHTRRSGLVVLTAIALSGLTSGSALAAAPSSSAHPHLTVTHSLRVAAGTQVTFSTKGSGLPTHDRLVSWSLNYGDRTPVQRGGHVLSPTLRHDYFTHGTYTVTFAMTDAHKHRSVRTLKVHTSYAALGTMLSSTTPGQPVPAGSGADLAFVAGQNVTFQGTLVGKPTKHSSVEFFVQGKRQHITKGSLSYYFGTPGTYLVATGAVDPAGLGPLRTLTVDILPRVTISAATQWTAGAATTVLVTTPLTPMPGPFGLSLELDPAALPLPKEGVGLSTQLLSTVGEQRQFSVVIPATGSWFLTAVLRISNNDRSTARQQVQVTATSTMSVTATATTTQADGDPSTISVRDSDPRPVTSWAASDESGRSLGYGIGTFPSAGITARFTSVGSHTVDVHLFFDFGDVILTSTVDVAAPPSVSVTTTTASVAVGHPVSIAVAAATSASSVHWSDWGVTWDVNSDPDGTFTDGTPPTSLSHTYSVAGTYDIYVEVDDDHGGYAQADVVVTVS